jgi:hypothetical protein
VACGWVITLWWKISVHAAIAAGAATALLLVFGQALLAAWPWWPLSPGRGSSWVITR